MEKTGYTYILANPYNTTLYIGVTSDLYARTLQHKNKHFPKSFSAKYNCNKLVWYQEFDSIKDAIAREKQIKGWKRFKKIVLIETMNPEWKDLFDDLYVT